jgi:eukaryotic-like serine/threonine-protein kinase
MSRRRLMREARSASALNHPNIVIAYEAARYGDTDLIAMERVQGKTLRELVGRSGLDGKTTLRYAVQIPDALAPAHDAHTRI